VTHNLAGADPRKKPLCPNLNHSIPEIGTKQFDRGTNNGSKKSHGLVDLGNMMLLSKAKESDFDPCTCGVIPVLDSHKEKRRRVGEAQEKNFQQQQAKRGFATNEVL
jgi:hypothetical protein